MRFYEIVIRQNGKVYQPPSMQGLDLKNVSYSSLINGRPNPSALDLYVNIPSFSMSNPRQGAMVRLSGISMADMSQITHLVDADIEVYAGMLDGYLPLSKHYSPDMLIRGVVYQTSGNWEGTNTTLDINITTPTTRNPSLGAHPNLTLDWQVGQPLEPALRKFLEQAYGKSATNPKGADVAIQISNELIAPAPMPGTFTSVIEFGIELKRFTALSFKTIKRIDNAPYRGVELFWRDNTIFAVDGSQAPPPGGGTHGPKDPLILKFWELMGQPTWKTFNQLNFKTVMRGDIQLGDYVRLPENLNSPYILTTALGTGQAPNDRNGMGLPSKNPLSFSGTFYVQEVLHSGQFRAARGMDWTSSFDCFVPGALVAAEPLTKEEPKPSEPHPPPVDPTNPIHR